MHKIAIVAWLAAALGTSALDAAAADRRLVTDPKPLLLEAIDAPDGKASGQLTGPVATALARRFGSQAPILIDVSTLMRYAQSGCRRLNIRVSQDNVVLKGQSPKPMQLDAGINYCRDGKPPRQLTLEKP